MPRARLQTAWDVFVASDPGFERLISALSAGLAIGVGIAAQYGFAQLAHPLWSGGPGAVAQHRGVTLLAMLLGGIISMIATIAVSDPAPRGQAITLLGAPLPMLASMAGAIALSSHRLSGIVVLTLVTGIGTWARALTPVIGQRAFLYGMLLFMGYFFGFLAGSEIPLGQLPWVAAILWLAVLVNLALRLSIFNRVAAGALGRSRLSVSARARRAVEAILGVLDAGERDERARRRLRRSLARLNENALILDGRLADPAAGLTGREATRIHEQLFALELDLDNLARAVSIAVTLPLPAPLRAAARGWVADLREGETRSARAFSEGHGDSEAIAGLSERARDVTYALAALATEAGEALGDWEQARDPAGAREDARAPAETDADEAGEAPGSLELYESPVTLFAGNLVGSGTASRSALDPSGAEGLAARLHLDVNAQSALRVMVAVGVTAAVASLVSAQRFYWAVIAVFISFMGANTASEQLLKALNRVVGTLVGIIVGSLLAQVIGPSAWSLVVILPAVMIGLYLQRVSYALMSAAITTMVALLYVQLGEYSASLLVMRLELTALGAVIAMLAALLVFPVRTRRVIRQAAVAVLEALRSLVEDLPRPGRGGAERPRPTAGARALDDALMQLIVTARPLSREPWGREDLRHNLALLTVAGHYARNLAAASRSTSDPDAALDAEIDRICAAEAATLTRLIAAIRDGQDPAPGETPLATVADAGRRLADAGVPRNDPRRRLLRSFARLDATLDRLGRNLAGEAPEQPDPLPAPPAPAAGLSGGPA